MKTKSKINIIVTLESEQELSPVEKIQLMESFCRIKNGSDVSLNGTNLKFEISDAPFVITDSEI